MEQVITVVSLLVALSVASERLVEIVKGLVPFLNQENKDPKREGWRKAGLQALGVISGILTAALAYPAVQMVVPASWSAGCVIPLGLLASGGSGFWNAILSYVLQVKNIAKKNALKYP